MEDSIKIDILPLLKSFDVHSPFPELWEGPRGHEHIHWFMVIQERGCQIGWPSVQSHNVGLFTGTQFSYDILRVFTSDQGLRTTFWSFSTNLIDHRFVLEVFHSKPFTRDSSDLRLTQWNEVHWGNNVFGDLYSNKFFILKSCLREGRYGMGMSSSTCRLSSSEFVSFGIDLSHGDRIERRVGVSSSLRCSVRKEKGRGHVRAPQYREGRYRILPEVVPS